MKNIKSSKKFIKIVAMVFVCFMILNVALSGINTVPKEYRNIPVSFLTPDLDWCSRPSDVILKYGLPQEISGMNSETGSINYRFEFDYEDEKIEFIAFTRYFPNGRLNSYNFYIDCKTPEEAERFFEECHNNMMELYRGEQNFKFRGTGEFEDYIDKDGEPCSYTISSNDNGEEQIYIIDDATFDEIPLEEAENIEIREGRINDYIIWSGAIGVNFEMRYTKNDPVVFISSHFQY